MALRSTRRKTAAIVGIIGLALVATACGGEDEPDGTAAPSGDSPGAGKPECAVVEQFGDLTGKEISVYGGIREPEDAFLRTAWAPFETCTGAKVNYEGSAEFEAQILVRIKSGNAPDVAFFPQPGLLADVVRKAPEAIKEVPAEVLAQVDANFDAGWKIPGTVDGKYYAAPLGSNVKSFVWYSPKQFTANGWAIPQTWDEMLALSDTIAATGEKPWCAGIGSGEATGWPMTDWAEDLMLRVNSPEVYDQWVNHEIPFNDPQVVAVFDAAGTILKNDKYVNGGLGDVKSIATTTFQDGGLPILKDKCSLHRQASFYAAQFPAGTTVAEDGDIWAFYFPPVDPAKGKPVLVAGEFVGAFADRIEVTALNTYLASTDFANNKAQANLDAGASGWVTANKNANAELFTGVDKLSVEILQDPTAVTRFDGSDLMPAAVGSSAFWKGATDWITGKSTQETVDFIESQWPTS